MFVRLSIRFTVKTERVLSRTEAKYICMTASFLFDPFLIQIFEDKFALREILSISVGCTNRSSGCSWSGELRDLEVRKQS